MLKKITAAALSTAMCATAVFSGSCPAASYQQSADAALTEYNTSVAYKYAADTTTTSVPSPTVSTTTTTTAPISSTSLTTTSSALSSTTSTTTTAAISTTTTSINTDNGYDEQDILEVGRIGNTITYTLYMDGYMYITGQGSMNNYTKCPFKKPQFVKNVVIANDPETPDQSITDIGSYIFYGCSNLKTVTIPDTIASIKNHTFENCSSLENIIIRGKEAPKAGNIVIPDSLHSDVS